MKKIRQSSYSFHYPQWQTARANVMANLTSLNKLPICKERFSINSLFASNIIYSFQIFVLTLFLVIHTEFAQISFSSAKGLVPFLLSFVSFALCSLGNNHRKANSVP